MGGIVAAGVVYGLIALIVMGTGSAWLEHLMPPVVTGAVVAVIGLNLAPVAVKAVSGTQFDAWIGLITVLIISLIAVTTTGIWQRLPIIIGAAAGYVLYLLFTNGLGWGKPIDLTALVAARAILKSRSGATKTLVCCVETRCVDDIERPGMLHGAFLRSPPCSRGLINRQLCWFFAIWVCPSGQRCRS